MCCAPSTRTDIAEPLTFAVIGLVDATANRWLRTVSTRWDSGELADFLSAAIWYLVEGQLRGLGVYLDPDSLSPS